MARYQTVARQCFLRVIPGFYEAAMKRLIIAAAGLTVLAAVLSSPCEAAPRCRNTGSFDAWLAAFKRDAAAQGISQRAISAALDGVTFDPAIIRRDNGQGG